MKKILLPAILPALLLAGLTGMWSVIFVLAKWHQTSETQAAFFFVILIQLGVMLWGLIKSNDGEKTFVEQFLVGLVISLLASVLIFCISMVLNMYAFPNYFTEVKVAMENSLKAQNLKPEEIAAAMKAAEPSFTPIAAAMGGMIGTIFTGVVFSAIISAFFSKKGKKVLVLGKDN